jgi:hypothetical protein
MPARSGGIPLRPQPGTAVKQTRDNGKKEKAAQEEGGLFLILTVFELSSSCTLRRQTCCHSYRPSCDGAGGQGAQRVGDGRATGEP